MKKGFTIVELLMVVGILGILMTIVTTAAAGAVKQARGRRGDALVSMVQAGIATYYAQNDEWPAFSGNGKKGNYKVAGEIDSERYELSESECDNVVRELVRKSVGSGANPYLDVMGLFVAKQGIVSARTYGLDFSEAIHGSKRSPEKMKIGQMMFGYPDKETGRFKRFKMVYSIPTDQLTVSK